MKNDKDKEFEKILKENNLILNKLKNIKEKRHVSEPEELVFKELKKEFNLEYIKKMVHVTSIDVLKIFKDEI